MSKTNALPADTLVVLQRGACERRCAVYRLMVFADGSIIYDGLSYVRKAGLVKAKISLEAVKSILDRADALKFSELSARYDEASGCQMADATAPMAIVTIVANGRAKTVQHATGCIGEEPERLKQLESMIDTTVGSRRWIR